MALDLPGGLPKDEEAAPDLQEKHRAPIGPAELPDEALEPGPVHLELVLDEAAPQEIDAEPDAPLLVDGKSPFASERDLPRKVPGRVVWRTGALSVRKG